MPIDHAAVLQSADRGRAGGRRPRRLLGASPAPRGRRSIRPGCASMSLLRKRSTSPGPGPAAALLSCRPIERTGVRQHLRRRPAGPAAPSGSASRAAPIRCRPARSRPYPMPRVASIDSMQVRKKRGSSRKGMMMVVAHRRRTDAAGPDRCHGAGPADHLRRLAPALECVGHVPDIGRPGPGASGAGQAMAEDLGQMDDLLSATRTPAARDRAPGRRSFRSSAPREARRPNRWPVACPCRRRTGGIRGSTTGLSRGSTCAPGTRSRVSSSA